MTNRSLQHLLKLSVVSSAALLALSARADLRGQVDKNQQEHNADRREHSDDRREQSDDRRERNDLVQLATGQYVSPTIIKGAVQQFVNPGLAAYPNFVAGEAVRSQLSPDGTTLAIITAGQNSLDKPDGTVDTANSTQFIFLYNVAGPNKARPVLIQVIQQVNAHVGLVFSPDGNTLYAAGGAVRPLGDGMHDHVLAFFPSRCSSTIRLNERRERSFRRRRRAFARFFLPECRSDPLHGGEIARRATFRRA